MGVRDLPEMHPVEERGVIALDGVQRDTPGRIGIGVGYDSPTQRRAGVMTTGEGGNEIVVFHDALQSSHAVAAAYEAAAAWEGSGWSNPAQHVADLLSESKATPAIAIMNHQTTPHPERLEREPK
jgi:hypothetical protein